MTHAQTDLQVTGMRCERGAASLTQHRRHPRLSWQLDAPGRNRRQTAYQLVVSSATPGADPSQLWDSGRCNSAIMHTQYGGPALQSGQQYSWTVRVWDDTGAPSPWSEAQTWGMGLLEPADWSAEWIEFGPHKKSDLAVGPTYDAAMAVMDPAPLFRRDFTTRSDVTSAIAYVSAHGLYSLYLNGEQVGDDQLAPGWTDYRTRLQYHAHDVTELIRDGANTLGSVVGDGWYAGFFGYDAKRAGKHYGDTPALLGQLLITYADGSTDTITTDESWRCAHAHIRYADLLAGEFHDARAYPHGWNEPGFDDTAWAPVRTRPMDPTVALVGEINEPVRVTESVRPTSIRRCDPDTVLVDFGQNLVGHVRLSIDGAEGQMLTLRHGERLQDDGSLYTGNLRTARQIDGYVCSGRGIEVFEPELTYHGFQFVEISGLVDDITAESITAEVVHSDMRRTGTFTSPNPTVDRFVTNVDWTLRGNFASIPTDCPQRDERLGWTGDAQVFARTATYLRDTHSFYTKWFQDVVDAQYANGAFPDNAPQLSLGAEGCPGWGDAGVIIPWTVLTMYGDERLAADNWDALQRWIDYVAGPNPDLIRRHRTNMSFNDWLCPGGDKTPPELVGTAFWAWDARMMSQMAEVLGRDDDAKSYSTLADRLSDAFRAEFLHADGTIGTDTLTGYALAVRMGLVPATSVPQVREKLRAAIARADWHPVVGFLGVGHLLPALCEMGLTEDAYRTFLQPDCPSWLYQVGHGATTVWERWDGWTAENGWASPGMNSFNQYGNGAVVEWLYRYVAGIDVPKDTFGLQTVVIRPFPSAQLGAADCSFGSSHGTITSSWELVDQALTLRVRVPANVKAHVWVPTSDHSSVTSEEALDAVEFADGRTKYTIGSGEYGWHSQFHPA